jgi:hypothetical protein
MDSHEEKRLRQKEFFAFSTTVAKLILGTTTEDRVFQISSRVYVKYSHLMNISISFL